MQILEKCWIKKYCFSIRKKEQNNIEICKKRKKTVTKKWKIYNKKSACYNKTITILCILFVAFKIKEKSTKQKIH